MKYDFKQVLLGLGERPIAFQRAYAALLLNGRKIGVQAGLFLSQAMYWSATLPPHRQGWFFKTAVEWEQETELTEKEQRNARTKLKQLGILNEMVRKANGNPTVHYQVDLDALACHLANLVSAKTPKPNCSKGETLTENTTETTSFGISKLSDCTQQRAKRGEGRLERKGIVRLENGHFAPILGPKQSQFSQHITLTERDWAALNKKIRGDIGEVEGGVVISVGEVESNQNNQGIEDNSINIQQHLSDITHNHWDPEGKLSDDEEVEGLEREKDEDERAA